jgi:hypothetical protein
MFDPFPNKKLSKILKKIIIKKKKHMESYIITFNPPKIISKNSKLKLIKKINRNTYPSMIFKIK